MKGKNLVSIGARLAMTLLLALCLLPAAALAEDAPSRTLIAYFTRLDNTDATLDEIIQGGGPYGALGASWAEADLDAIASASITLIEGNVHGNTQAIAEMIQQAVGGDLFSIQTVDTYPVNYDDLIDQGGEEGGRGLRPALRTTVEDMDSYDTVFLGFPNWWGDMPMAAYAFLDAYDFSGKTLIPFATSASSGLARTVRQMQEMLPECNVVDHGLHVRMYDIANAQETVAQWLKELDLPEETI